MINYDFFILENKKRFSNTPQLKKLCLEYINTNPRPTIVGLLTFLGIAEPLIKDWSHKNTNLEYRKVINRAKQLMSVKRLDYILEKDKDGKNNIWYLSVTTPQYSGFKISDIEVNQDANSKIVITLDGAGKNRC